MAKVRTFARNFPSYHPQVGQNTFFVEKILQYYKKGEYLGSLYLNDLLFTLNKNNGISPYVIGDFHNSLDMNIYDECLPKYHTIREGNHFKVGDMFSPRVWSELPYKSKQIIFAPDIEVKQVYNFALCQRDKHLLINDNRYYPESYEDMIEKIAKNDGLTVEQFKSWFNKPFIGQIICWADNSIVSY